MQINQLFLFACLLSSLISSPALAVSVYNVPKLTKAGTASGSAVVKTIKDTTRVVGTGFQVVIPKGWTLNPTGESDMHISSFNANPTEAIETDPVYLGVHTTKKDFDLKTVKKKQLATGRKVQEKNGASFQSVQVEYLESKTNSRDERVFLWFVKSKNRTFIVLAGAPVNDQKSLGSLRSILSSLSFK